VGTMPTINPCAQLSPRTSFGRMVNIVESIAERVTSVGAKASYGDPVSVGGVELVPVALVWFGFGGGSDTSENGGGGGGGVSVPIGAYVRGADGVRFKPNLIALVAVSVPIAWALSWAIVGAGAVSGANSYVAKK
jgi:hypothetical protein